MNVLPAPPAAPLVLVLGTAEWDATIATNQHGVTAELAREVDVVFAEGTGTRRLRPTAADLGRVLHRLRPAAGQARRPLPARTTVVGPRVVPHHGPATSAVNGRALRRQLRTWVEHPGPRVLWTYTPFTYGLERDADATVYHLVDLLHHNPGVPADRLLAAERALADRCDLALATSVPIGAHLGGQGFGRVEVLPNVADTRPFAEAAARRRADAALPVVLFVGALAAHKLDLPLLEHLAARLAGRARLRLVGPLGAPSPAWDRLVAAGVELLPPVGRPALAEQVAAAAVGLVPYAVNALTAGISPLKRYEYLAAGLPVVSTALPEMHPVPGAVWVEPTPEAFADRVLALLGPSSDDDRARRQQLAAQHDWTGRGEQLRGLLAGLLAAAAGTRAA